MDEKKLTDEEIAKAILQQIEYNAGIPYINEWKQVKTIKFTEILDLIHRLQADNKQLRGIVSGLEDEKKVESIIFGLKETIAEQKAEIERLKDENIEERDIHFKNLCGYKDEIARLQKQVDELKLELQGQFDKGVKAGCLMSKVKEQQAVKDTAKEIIADMFKEIEGYERIDRVLERIAERYGVEVE